MGGGRGQRGKIHTRKPFKTLVLSNEAGANEAGVSAGPTAKSGSTQKSRKSIQNLIRTHQKAPRKHHRCSTTSQNHFSFDSPGFARIHQDSQRFTRTHKDSPGFTRIHENPLKPLYCRTKPGQLKPGDQRAVPPRIFHPEIT